MNIGFIGCGAMGEALLKGLLSSKFIEASNVFVTTRTNDKKEYLKETYKVNILKTNKDLVLNSEVIFLATKPNSYVEVINEIKDLLTSKHILISITPSFTLEELIKLTDNKTNIVRTMPNTPSMVGLGMTGIVFDKTLELDKKEDILKMFNSFGKTIEIEEKMLPILSSLSGSGPAFVYLFMDSIMKYGINNGFSEAESRLLVSQTLIGAATMVSNSNVDMQALISNVCSKGGSTIEGVNSFKENQMYEIVEEALNQTTNKFIKMMVK